MTTRNKPTAKPTLMESLLLCRRRNGWTQAEAARRLGVPTRTLAAWECGETQPKPIVRRSIAEFIRANS